MNKLKYLILLIGILGACDDRDIDCEQGEGSSFRVENQEGQAFFDNRFDTYVVRHHVVGTIDSFRTFVICNTSEDLGLEKDVIETVIFSGQAQALKERHKPNALIAGEEFFVIFLDEIKPAGTD